MPNRPKLRPLKDQVIVLTGATSGIGRATAQLAAKKGAKLVLCSRSFSELKELKSQLPNGGEQAEIVEADVAIDDDMQRVARAAIQRFGRIDTWINNAGISIYGRLTQVPMAEKRRLFDVNFWGVVHGCKAAVPHLKKNGGALINVGSILSERAIPLQGIYSASKHAVKAYTDSLRMELEADKLPISVTLVKPGAIDTGFTIHAQNHLTKDGHPVEPVHVPPVYSPEVAARAILTCATKPMRDVYVGGSAKLYSLIEKYAPRVGDIYMEHKMMESDTSLDKAPREEEQELFRKTGHATLRGNFPGRVKGTSLYTSSVQHPLASLLIAAGLTSLMAVFGATRWRWAPRVSFGFPDSIARYRESVTSPTSVL